MDDSWGTRVDSLAPLWFSDRFQGTWVSNIYISVFIESSTHTARHILLCRHLYNENFFLQIMWLWVWEVQWGVNLKTPPSSIWIIKMIIYRDRLIFETGNPYSGAVGLPIETWHNLEYKVVVGWGGGGGGGGGMGGWGVGGEGGWGVRGVGRGWGGGGWSTFKVKFNLKVEFYLILRLSAR